MSGIQDLRSTSQRGFLYEPPEWLLDCSYVEESASALALGALEPDEVVRINHHLSWCPSCAALVHECRKTVNYLPFLAPQAAPSASAKSSLFARIDALQQLEKTNPHELWGGTASVLPQEISPTIPALPRLNDPVLSNGAGGNPPSAKRRMRWDMLIAPLAAVPLVVALAIVGGWALRTQDQLDSQVAHAATLENENANLAAQVGLLSNTLDSSSREFSLISVDSDLGSSVGGSVIASSNRPWAKISVWNLPSSATGYQVMVETDDGKWVRALEFTPDKNGSAERELHLDSPLDQYNAIHIQPMQSKVRTSTNDSAGIHDILWTQLDSNLGATAGTEANAKAH